MKAEIRLARKHNIRIVSKTEETKKEFKKMNLK
jgi:hypothetical protein